MAPRGAFLPQENFGIDLLCIIHNYNYRDAMLWLLLTLPLAIIAVIVVEWKPLSLVHSCTRQRIPGFSLPWVSWPNERDLSWSWDMLNSIKRHGKIFYVKFRGSVRLFIVDPIMIRQILIKNETCYRKPSFITTIEILSGGLFSANGEVWHHQRQLFGPAFHSKQLKEHFHLIKKYALDEMESWNKKYPGSNAMDIHKQFLKLMVVNISHIAFGAHIEQSSNIAEIIYKSFDRYLHNCRTLLCNPFSNIPGYRYLPSSVNKEIAEDKEQLFTIVRDFILNKKSDVCLRHETNNPKFLLDFMSNELSEDTSLPEKEVLGNCMTFLLAGHETTASLLTWTVYLLAIYPLWQERSRAEVQEFGRDQELELIPLSHLKTLNLVIFESLRLFPPQPIIGRSCVKENKVADYVIKQGLDVVIPVTILHYDKELWGEDAEDFRPSRFANGINGACKDPLSFLPFGSGPRTCIGQALALLEARTILALMLRSYSWKLSPHYQHCPDIALTLQPRFGMPIILERF